MSAESGRGKGFFFRQRGELGYAAEVGLIIFSILFAFWIERLREDWVNQAKLDRYLSEIRDDLDEEIKTSAMNLYDCKNDLQLLHRNLDFAQNRSADSTLLYRNNFLSVFYRGVFRSFGSTTVEIMANQGDLELIENDSLQKQLLSVFAFRDLVQTEFGLFDAECSQASKSLFVVLNLASNQHYAPPAAELYKDEHTRALFLLERRANYKSFIINCYLDDLKAARDALDQFVQNKK